MATLIDGRPPEVGLAGLMDVETVLFISPVGTPLSPELAAHRSEVNITAGSFWDVPT